MTAEAWRDHLVSLDEWDAMPEDKNLELVDGVLHVAASPEPRHQRAGRRLAHSLEMQLPDELSIETEVDVLLKVLPRATVRKPDIVVVPVATWGDGRRRFTAADVLLAVEIVSPGSEKTDRQVKPDEYAEAGIPHYWIVEFDDESISLGAYVLVDGRYEYVGGGTGKVELLSPAPLVIDLDALTLNR
ncbi:hypothetical protein BBK82_23465 [Lentzea guizhouensis]|uniref:Putative restriction endonuclease domain-containing protein n=1 Tax=Lentzea guizhouensis TaxID=1586287 RepID=A0A1B2HLI5_9PSEU|nr:Uma2 family endonuclease [Lentzea guizhouensis]ANZ38579.1 hypothetical protein BBK82_23465 [Lentzea guizhouensis]